MPTIPIITDAEIAEIRRKAAELPRGYHDPRDGYDLSGIGTLAELIGYLATVAREKSWDEVEVVAVFIKVAKLVGRTGWPNTQKDYGPVFDHLPPATQFNAQQIDLPRECFEKSPEGLAEARKLKDMPHGRIPNKWDPSGLWLFFPDHHEVRSVCDLLQHDAMLRVLEVKAAAGEAATTVTDLAMRVCGGAAFRREVGVERNFRDSRAAGVMAPPTDALLDFIGRVVCGMPLFDPVAEG